jgi:cell division septal protein FtsQ
VKPPSTVSVRIVERRPVVALAVGTRFAVLGDDLVVVSIGPSGHGVPEVVDRIKPVPWTRAGAPVASRAAQIAIAVLPAIPESIRADLIRVIVHPGPDLTLVLGSGLEIRAGGTSGIAERLAEVPQVLAALHARGLAAAALDLRYAGSIAVTLATGGEAR